MRAIGGVLMVSGWLIVVASLVLLKQMGERWGFLAAGLGVEVLGLVLLAQRYRAGQMPEEAR